MSSRTTAVELDDERIRALYPRVRSRLVRYLGPRQDIDDVVQAAMETLLKVMSNYSGRGSVESFAEGVAVNVARRYLAIGRLRRRVSDLFSETVLPEDLVTDSRNDVQGNRRLQRLMGILDDMGSRRRLAFVMHVLEGRPMKEVADALGITPQAVKSRVFQARKELLQKASADPYLREFLEELDR